MKQAAARFCLAAAVIFSTQKTGPIGAVNFNCDRAKVILHKIPWGAKIIRL